MPQAYASNQKKRQWWKLLLKLIVTAICIWYVSGKIDFQKAGAALKTANPWFLLIALLIYITSKVISSYRLNFYFRNIGIHIAETDNLKLYWLGMFYNLFLPGSISGDAYKVILLTKRYNHSYKKTAAAVLLDRFSGLLGLGLILSIYGFFVLNHPAYEWLLFTGAIVSVVLVFYVIRKWFTDFVPGFMPTLLLGVLVQAAQVLCAYFILASLNIPVTQTAYIFLFLASSVVSVLPLTIGGLGIREIVFMEGALYFGLLRETAVVISILFYLITLFTSATGMIYIFKDPLKKRKDSLLNPST
jgi:uncharacterized membrane protein YbhN (UPF0104 family)